MRALKILGIALGGLVLLFVLLLLAARVFVDPNDYKDRIAQAVRKSTGRELALPGQIKLAVFPWLALEFGPASLGNPPGFGAEPFVAVQHVALRVKLLPLLRKRLQIGRIEVDGLDLRLLRNAEGAGNWQGFGGESAASESQPASTPGEMLSELGGVLVKDGRLSYQDLVAEHVNLEVGRAASGLAVPVSLQLDLTPHSGGSSLALASRFDVVPDFARQQYRLAPFELSGKVTPGSGAAALPWKVSVPELSLDLATQTARAPGFAAQLSDARLAGSLLAEQFLDALRISGTFKLEPLGLRQLMRQLGLTPPETRDPKALSRFAASGEFAFGGNALRATKLVVQLDDSSLRGDAAVTDLDSKAISADLALDRIVLDRYLSPSKPGAAARPGDLPTTGLRALRMKGQFAIGSATIFGLDVAQIRLTVVAKDGIVHISPAVARLYGGNYSGDITADVRGALPVIKADQSMTGIDVAPLLTDLARIQRISGHGNVTSNVTARGSTSEQVLKSLNGHVAAELAEGAVDGMDLWFEIRRALALVQQQTLPAGSSSGRTRFDTFKASADLKDGVASSRDLTIVSQNLRVTGQGTVNLATNAISYQAKATILKEAPTAHAAPGAVLADIPLTITGTLTSPQVRPDLAGIAKARVQQELDKNKGQLQQKLEEQLKGLFR